MPIKAATKVGDLDVGDIATVTTHGGTRTYQLMASALRGAGFWAREVVKGRRDERRGPHFLPNEAPATKL